MKDVYELNTPPAAHGQTEVAAARVRGQRAALVSNVSPQMRLSQHISRVNEHAVCVPSACQLILSDSLR